MVLPIAGYSVHGFGCSVQKADLGVTRGKPYEPVQTPANQCKISFQINKFHGIVALELPQMALSCTTCGQNSDLLRPIQPLNAHCD